MMGRLIDTDALTTALIDAYGLDPERLRDVVERIPAAAQPTQTNTFKALETLDCISRQAALDAIGEQPLVWTDDDDFARGEATQWEYDTEAIKALPSAQPRIRGRWQEITEGDCSGYDPVLAGYDDPVVGYVCSVCHEGYEKEVIGEVTWNFCPNCGADMRERGEDAPN